MESLKILRKQKGLTQNDISQFLGISRAAYTRYETGQRQPDNDMLARLADYFNVTIDYLLGREDNKKTASEIGGGSEPLDVQLMGLLCHLTVDQKEFLLAQIETLIKSQK